MAQIGCSITTIIRALIFIVSSAGCLYSQTIISLPQDFPPKAILFQDYDSGAGTLSPMHFIGTQTFTNGDLTSSGPVYTSQDNAFPYVMLDTARNLFLFHSGTLSTVKEGAVVSAGIGTAGTYNLSGSFARANDLQNGGDGVRVVVFANRQIGTPLFDAVISSNNVVNPTDLFSGTGVAPFNLTVALRPGDSVQFAVFSGPNLVDGTFDLTALRFTMSGGGTSISLPPDFPPKPILFQEYDSSAGTLSPMHFIGTQTFTNGDLTSVGPVYTSQGNAFPHVMLDTARNLFLFHPGTFPTVKEGAVVSAGIGTAGTYNLSGAFARANDFQNGGDGVRVVVFVNRQIGTPLFDALISSNNVVNPTDLFSGTGVAPFNLTVALRPGDSVQFAVFSGPNLVDGTFDLTALKFTITSPVTAPLVLSQSGATFRAETGSPNQLQRTISVAAAAKAISWTATPSTISGGSWLKVAPTTGTSDLSQPAPTLQIIASAASLQPGDYYGLVTINPTNMNSSQIISVVLNVLPSAQGPGAVVEPTGVLFVGAPGGAVPGAQNVQISNPATAAIGFTTIPTFSGTSSWFSYQPTTGVVAPNQPLKLSVQPVASVPAGIYNGSILFKFSDGKTRVANLVFVVAAGAGISGASVVADSTPAANACTPSKLVPVLTLLGVSFASPVAWPAAIEASIVDDCGAPLTAGTVFTSFSNGDVPLALSSLQNGHWTATWVPVHPVTSALTATLNAQSYTPALVGTTQVSGTTPPNPKVPIISSGGVVGTASYVAFPSPGAFVSVFGTALADSVTSATQLPLPTLLATTSVFLGGVKVPLVFVTENQINALLPYGVSTKAKYQVIILRAGALSTPETIAVLDTQPAVFTVDQSGKGQGHIYRIPPEGGQVLASPAAPVTAGDVLTIYCAGLGEVQPPLDAGVQAPLGTLEYTVNTVTATIGGVGANVLFSGLTPGFTGLYQVNLVVPVGVVPDDAVGVVLNAAGQTSVPVTIAVR